MDTPINNESNSSNHQKKEGYNNIDVIQQDDKQSTVSR